MTKNKIFIRPILLIFIIGFTSIRADAFVPVSYTCCKNYSYSDGVQIDNFEYRPPFSGIQLDNFENISNWTVGGIGASQMIDTVNFKEGSQGLKLIAKNGNRVITGKIINENFSNTDNFALWVYIYDVNTLLRVRLEITSTGNNWNKYFYKSKSTGYKNGWNRIVFDKRFFANVGNENWNNTMNRVRIVVYPITETDTNVTVDDLRYNVENDWVGSYQDSDTINFKEGLQGLKLIATNGDSVYSDFTINKDFSNINNFAVWVYINDASNLQNIRLYITSDQFNRYFYDTVYYVRSGWNRLVFNKHNFKNNFNESWNNIMTSIRLRIDSSTGNDLNVTFDDLRNNMTGQRAIIMIEFDDGRYNAYSNAYPILNANNQTGVSYVFPSHIGKSGYMNISDLRVLQSASWDISSHTYSHVDLVSVNDSTLISELNNSYDWLIVNNFQKSAGFISYPYGHFNDAVLDKVEKRYVLGRAVAYGAAQQHLISDSAIRYIQRVISVPNDSTVQDVKDKINDTINAKLLGILMFHNIVDNDNPQQYEYSRTGFKVISDYIKSRENDVDVITNSEYVIPIINNFAPVLNKTTRIYSNGSSVVITNNKYDEYMPNMTVKPSSDFIDINITIYDETGGLIMFNESGPNGDMIASYNIGDRIPNQLYSVKIYWTNGTKYQDFNVLSNDTGYISYDSEGFRDSRYQEIGIGQVIDTIFTVTLPIGYTFLRFNASNSTIINLDPDGQNNSQPIFNITNNGNIIQNFGFYLNGTVANIITYADLDNDHTNGRLEINTTLSTVVPNLNPGSSQNVWVIIDTSKAMAINTNKTLTINSS